MIMNNIFLFYIFLFFKLSKRQNAFIVIILKEYVSKGVLTSVKKTLFEKKRYLKSLTNLKTKSTNPSL